ncbi:hypothetical protein KDJ56_05685 [Brevibacillus composti]|uniref:D-glucuronyl C5-epimerase C-terminal domain-containing protein n=1 Tax=Brevibacillus composti TaxID=2796470 RepID=A0A7T5EMP2_9BACL|nr:hypothetical protein [Brevibacillus composti]QQE75459.1 hypothetical protein JD108_06005 [Brevibacillus composti]QUO42485.1 hypothetical protein KDJ56_05685 [Brevibacillus composti]
MTKFKKYLLLMYVGLLMMLTPMPVQTNAFQWEKPQILEEVVSVNGGALKQRVYHFPNGDVYRAYRLEGQMDSHPHGLTFPLSSEGASFRYAVNRDGQTREWTMLSLLETNQLPLVPGFVESSNRYLLIGAPIVYQPLGKTTIEEKKEWAQPISVIQEWYRVHLEVQLPVKAGLVSEWWVLESRSPQVPWESQQTSDLWLKLDFTEKAKWLFDGYYYASPSTYVPSTPQSFWRNPENYIVRPLLAHLRGSAAQELAYVMLDTAVRNQEPEGHWKTYPLSQWLSQDYGIQDGFYDTRFNTGMAELLLEGCKQYDDTQFCESAQKYAQYLRDHASRHHYEVNGPQPGWLVADYTHPAGHLPTHVSLNHQLAEINFLWKMYMHFHDPTNNELANVMLFGVTNLGERWLASNGDLHYAWFPDDTLGRPDYPYLTYNDLRETQRLYRELYGVENQTIAMLMQSKEKWMAANGVVIPAALP